MNVHEFPMKLIAPLLLHLHILLKNIIRIQIWRADWDIYKLIVSTAYTTFDDWTEIRLSSQVFNNILTSAHECICLYCGSTE